MTTFGSASSVERLALLLFMGWIDWYLDSDEATRRRLIQGADFSTTEHDLGIGEIGDLRSLVADRVQDGLYEGFFASAPLNKRGGTGSPANALTFK